jgi:hypothetical protein
VTDDDDDDDGDVHIWVLLLWGSHNEMLNQQFRVCLCFIVHSGVPRIFFGGGSTNSVEDRGQRERGSGGGSPLVRGSGGSCNLVQEISFHITNFS